LDPLRKASLFILDVQKSMVFDLQGWQTLDHFEDEMEQQYPGSFRVDFQYLGRLLPFTYHHTTSQTGQLLEPPPSPPNPGGGAAGGAVEGGGGAVSMVVKGLRVSCEQPMDLVQLHRMIRLLEKRKEVWAKSWAEIELGHNSLGLEAGVADLLTPFLRMLEHHTANTHLERLRESRFRRTGGAAVDTLRSGGGDGPRGRGGGDGGGDAIGHGDDDEFDELEDDDYGGVTVRLSIDAVSSGGWRRLGQAQESMKGLKIVASHIPVAETLVVSVRSWRESVDEDAKTMQYQLMQERAQERAEAKEQLLKEQMRMQESRGRAATSIGGGGSSAGERGDEDAGQGGQGGQGDGNTPDLEHKFSGVNLDMEEEEEGEGFGDVISLLERCGCPKAGGYGRVFALHQRQVCGRPVYVLQSAAVLDANGRDGSEDGTRDNGSDGRGQVDFYVHFLDTREGKHSWPRHRRLFGRWCVSYCYGRRAVTAEALATETSLELQSRLASKWTEVLMYGPLEEESEKRLAEMKREEPMLAGTVGNARPRIAAVAVAGGASAGDGSNDDHGRQYERGWGYDVGEGHAKLSAECTAGPCVGRAAWVGVWWQVAVPVQRPHADDRWSSMRSSASSTRKKTNRRHTREMRRRAADDDDGDVVLLEVELALQHTVDEEQLGHGGPTAVKVVDLTHTQLGPLQLKRVLTSLGDGAADTRFERLDGRRGNTPSRRHLRKQRAGGGATTGTTARKATAREKGAGEQDALREIRLGMNRLDLDELHLVEDLLRVLDTHQHCIATLGTARAVSAEGWMRLLEWQARQPRLRLQMCALEVLTDRIELSMSRKDIGRGRRSIMDRQVDLALSYELGVLRPPELRTVGMLPKDFGSSAGGAGKSRNGTTDETTTAVPISNGEGVVEWTGRRTHEDVMELQRRLLQLLAEDEVLVDLLPAGDRSVADLLELVEEAQPYEVVKSAQQRTGQGLHSHAPAVIAMVRKVKSDDTMSEEVSAALARVRIGDVIKSVNGADMIGKYVDTVRNHLKGVVPGDRHQWSSAKHGPNKAINSPLHGAGKGAKPQQQPVKVCLLRTSATNEKLRDELRAISLSTNDFALTRDLLNGVGHSNQTQVAHQRARFMLGQVRDLLDKLTQVMGSEW
jgi:hypothetical protein